MFCLSYWRRLPRRRRLAAPLGGGGASTLAHACKLCLCGLCYVLPPHFVTLRDKTEVKYTEISVNSCTNIRLSYDSGRHFKKLIDADNNRQHNSTK